MLEVLKAIILDHQEARLETGVPRRLRIAKVPGKATVCIGVRRSGKSTYLFQLMQRLVDRGVPRQNLLYLNFFDDRLHNLRRENLGLVIEAYFSLYPEKKGAETVWCFFDEIQSVPGWEPFVDRILRTEKCEVYLTGSSAAMLSREIATQMRGRALSWEIYPFSFREFLDSRGLECDGPLSTKRRLLVQKAFEEYWTVGGFPEVVAQPAADGAFAAMSALLRVKTHQEYFQAVLFRDIIERHEVPHPKALGALAHRLVDNIASAYSVHKLAGYLKSLGNNVTRPAITEYMQWFEDAYFLFTVRLFDASLARSNTNPKRVYCVDHALVRSVASGVLVNSGHLLENLVFTALRRRHPEIFYFKTPKDKEVDFLIAPRSGERLLVQVCETLADPVTRQRETTALAEAMAELRLESGLIVTRSEEETIKTESGNIRVLPAWKFLLEMEAPAEQAGT